MQNIYANVWNYVFDNNIDLIAELPVNEFCLRQTREAEFENNAIKENKQCLKNFIKNQIERCKVQTISILGFNDKTLPESERRFGGFGSNSVWLVSKEKDFRTQHKRKLGNVKASTKLLKNEADIAIAGKSFDSIVLTFDEKPGPISDAQKAQGKVIFLKNFHNSGQTLKEYIYERIS